MTNKDLEEKLIKRYGYMPYRFNSEYSGCHTKMSVTCLTCNSTFDITPTNMTNIKAGDHHPCKNCMAIRTGNRLRSNINSFIEKFKHEFNIFPYEVLNPDDYKNIYTKLKFKCIICGSEFEAAPNNVYTRAKVSAGKVFYCPVCNKLERKDKSIIDRIYEVNKNIEVLSVPRVLKDIVKVQCSICGHVWNVSAGNLISGTGCPNCANINTTSKGEKEIVDFIKSIYNGKIIENDKSLLHNKKELDIYLPELNIAIEYNGLYWHNYEKRGSSYHMNKYLECHELGIHLLQIYEDEWINNRTIIESKLKHYLHLNNSCKKIYARSCVVKKINSTICNTFLEENHIQGKDISSYHYGLYYNDELVAVMTFCKPRISLGNNKNENYYELSRFATNINYIVLGAFGKLLKAFECEVHPKEIRTYAKLEFTDHTNNVYLKNGFKFSHISNPGYWYFHNNVTSKKYHRYSFRKSELKTKFPEYYEESLSEYEIMKKAGYRKIYNAGNALFIKTYK